MSKQPADPNEFYSLEDILSADDLPTLTLPIPEWGGKAVQIGTITAAQRLHYIRASQVGDGLGGEKVDMELSQLCLVQAALLAPALDLEGVKALFNKSAASWQRILNATLRFNKLDAASQEAMAAAFRADAGAEVSV